MNTVAEKMSKLFGEIEKSLKKFSEKTLPKEYVHAFVMQSQYVDEKYKPSYIILLNFTIKTCQIIPKRMRIES